MDYSTGQKVCRLMYLYFPHTRRLLCVPFLLFHFEFDAGVNGEKNIEVFLQDLRQIS